MHVENKVCYLVMAVFSVHSNDIIVIKCYYRLRSIDSVPVGSKLQIST
jgi:hypothetical protein